MGEMAPVFFLNQPINEVRRSPRNSKLNLNLMEKFSFQITYLDGLIVKFFTGRVSNNSGEMDYNVTVLHVFRQEVPVQNVSPDNLQMWVRCMRQKGESSPHELVEDNHVMTTLEQHGHHCWPQVACTTCYQHSPLTQFATSISFHILTVYWQRNLKTREKNCPSVSQTTHGRIWRC